MKYRKKPVVIDADQWLPNDRACRERVAMLPGAKIDGDKLLIATLEGTMTASPGDWVIRGVRGEYYPCKPDIFEATYEPVPQEKEERCQTADNRPSAKRPPVHIGMSSRAHRTLAGTLHAILRPLAFVGRAKRKDFAMKWDGRMFETKKVFCAPKIWKKLSEAQQRLWVELYETFLESTNFAVGWDGTRNKGRREVTAHNMACQAVWEMARLKIIEGRKTARNKQSAPLKYPCKVCGSNKDCAFVGSDPCPRR